MNIVEVPVQIRAPDLLRASETLTDDERAELLEIVDVIENANVERAQEPKR